MNIRYNLDKDIEGDSVIIDMLRDKELAKDYYRALCNRWKKIAILSDEDLIIEKLKGIDSYEWSCSWRDAAHLVADLRKLHYNTNDHYMDYYCSRFEGEVSGLVMSNFDRLGWEYIGRFG